VSVAVPYDLNKEKEEKGAINQVCLFDESTVKEKRKMPCLEPHK
jgi:hypothetical protein